MSKAILAEYDEATNTLQLLEPLEGFANHETVSIIVKHENGKRPWSHFRGILSAEDGQDLARVIDEAFPIEPIRK
jgi:hypothetical protein